MSGVAGNQTRCAGIGGTQRAMASLAEESAKRSPMVVKGYCIRDLKI